MNGDKIHINYSAEDIEQYFLGKLSPAAMHDMERAALDDPFLAEAMEGYEAMKNEEWKPALIAAKEKFAAKENTKKIAPVYRMAFWQKAAAAILIIGCGVALTYRLTNNTSTKNEVILADVKRPVAATDSINKSDTAKVNVAAPAEQTDIAAAENKEEHKPLIAEVKPVPVSDNSLYQYHQKNSTASANNKEVQNEDEVVFSGDSNKGAADNAALQEVTITPAPSAKATEANKTFGYKKNTVTNNEPLLNHSFSAQVVAPDNSPLPFANVAIVRENIGTYADVKGKFRLVGADSMLTVEVKAAGYMPQTYTLNSAAAQNTIVLPEIQLADKDIIKFNSKAKKSGADNRHAMQMDTVLNVEPADGWSNYDTYLSNNLAPSEELQQKNIHGEVEVTFDVERNGKISNVNVAKSLCAACDEEALRVIKQGPQWKVKKGKKDKGKVKVKF